MVKKADFTPPGKKPEIDINKPADFKPDGSFWHKPSSALWVYLLFIIASLYAPFWMTWRLRWKRKRYWTARRWRRLSVEKMKRHVNPRRVNNES